MAKKKAAKRGAEHKARIQESRVKKQEAGGSKFEFKYNRQKHAVLGNKNTLRAAGVPAASRKKSEENRRKTLLVEYERRSKSNAVVDKRLAEKDSTVSMDEKLTKRAILHHKKSIDGKTKSSDTAILTHGGIAVADIQKHDRPINDDLDDKQLQSLTAEFVSGAHFGGGDLDYDSNPNLYKSKKELIAELILKTKAQRAQKVMEREEVQNLTDRLDEQWKSFILDPKCSTVIHPSKEEKEERKAADGIDEFDKLVRELQFERMRSTAGPKMMNPEDLAKLERDKLEKLEEQRIMRMQALNSVPKNDLEDSEDERDLTVVKSKVPMHRSADDDMDGNLQFQHEKEEAFTVEYKNGRLLNEDKLKNNKVTTNKHVDIDEEDDFEHETQLIQKDKSNDVDLLSENCATSAIPFVFIFPENYADFVTLMKEYETKRIVLTRLIKCFHPRLSDQNRLKLKRLFLFTLRYFDSIAAQGGGNESGKVMNILNAVTPALYELAQFNANNAAKCCRALLTRYKDEFNKNKRCYPPMSCIAIMGLLPKLFPASDYWHAVMTPATLFLSQIIRRARNRDCKDVGKGLLLCSLMIDYTAESNRYVPEMVAFLMGTLFMAIADEKKSVEGNPMATFPSRNPHNQMLVVNEEEILSAVDEIPMKLPLSALFDPDFDPSVLKIACIHTAVGLLKPLIPIYKDLASFTDIFKSISKYLSRVEAKFLPMKVQESIENLVKEIDVNVKGVKRWSLMRPATMKRQLDLLEPMIETRFDPERPNRSKDSAILLKRRVRKEQRNTMRELRRDSQFIGRIKMKETMKKDRMRIRKTKELLGSLMTQEAEYKQFMKINGRK